MVYVLRGFITGDTARDESGLSRTIGGVTGVARRAFVLPPEPELTRLLESDGFVAIASLFSDARGEVFSNGSLERISPSSAGVSDWLLATP